MISALGSHLVEVTYPLKFGLQPLTVCVCEMKYLFYHQVLSWPGLHTRLGTGCIRCNPMAFLDQYEEGATMSKNMNRLNDDPCC